MAASLKQFVQGLTESGLMSPEEATSIRETLRPGRPFRDAEDLAKELVRRKTLTKYQASELYHGRTSRLVLGNYRLLQKMGEGGMGAVYKAEHRLMERLVALKVLNASLSSNEDAARRFKQEVKAAARLSHPNIVTAHDADEDKGEIFLVMEYVDGSDLKRLVEQSGALPIGLAANYILQAARGLQYAHARGVIHRDVKPSNLHLDKKDVIRLMDLGLAFFSEPAEDATSGRLTVEGQMMGTVDYMSPEQAEDTRDADARSDIYSLGCTLYRLVTAEAPYRGATMAETLVAHLQAPVPRLSERRSDAPEELEKIFARMVAKEPDDRYQTATEVIKDLEAFLKISPAATKQTAAVHSAVASPEAVPATSEATLTTWSFTPPRDDAPPVSEEPGSTIVYHAEQDTDASQPRRPIEAPKSNKRLLVAASAVVASLVILAAALIVLSVW